MSERKVIRLRAPLRSGIEIVPENAVIPTTAEIADELIAAGRAELTDATERYPNLRFLDVLDEYPVTGSEKFPKPPGVEPVFAEGAFGTEAEKRAAAEGRASVGPAWDHPEKAGDESSPAKGPAPDAETADDDKPAKSKKAEK